MNTAYDAVVELSGSTCRVAVGSRTPLQWYAHTEQHVAADAGAALLRLGDEPPGQAVLDAVLHHLAATVRTADVPIATLRVLVHSPAGLAVQAPLSATASASDCRRALMQQAALLTGARQAGALRLLMTEISAPLPRGASQQWYRGAIVPQGARQWVDQWAEAIDANRSTVAYSAAHTCDAAAPRISGWHLGIGSYGAQTEYTLWYGTTCAYLYYTPLAQTAADRAYFAALLLNRLRLADAGLDAAWAYGPDASTVPNMPPIAGVQPRLMKPPRSEAMARLHNNRSEPSTSDVHSGHPLRWAPLHSTLWAAAQ